MPTYTAQQFIDAMPGSGGVVTIIAARIGCDWHTAKKYIVKHSTVQQAYDDECEGVLDSAESAVIASILRPKDAPKDWRPDVPNAKWYLTMKGAGRGYAPKQRQEITGKGGEPLVKGYVVMAASPDVWPELEGDESKD